jgi:hypothetical protein
MNMSWTVSFLLPSSNTAYNASNREVAADCWGATWRREILGVDGLKHAAPLAEDWHALLVIAGEQSESDMDKNVSKHHADIRKGNAN